MAPSAGIKGVVRLCVHNHCRVVYLVGEGGGMDVLRIVCVQGKPSILRNGSFGTP